MTAGYQIFGNGGKYYKPYTYYYITDHDGNVIPGMDNRQEISVQAISYSTATIMNKLLNNVMVNGTGVHANISGWQTYGKTGTTDSNKDSWFIGGTPYAVAGVWTGYSTPRKTEEYQASFAKKIWKTIMSKYLSNKKKKDFQFDPNVISATFCEKTGLLVNPGTCSDTATGWYDKNNMPTASSSVSEPSSTASSSSEVAPASSSSSSSRVSSASSKPSSSSSKVSSSASLSSVNSDAAARG